MIIDESKALSMKPEDLLDELEHEVEEAEHELDDLGEEDTPALKEKHETAERLLGQIHEQIDFLREVAENENE